MIELDILSQNEVAADGQPAVWRSPEARAGHAQVQKIRQSEQHPGADDLSGADGPSRRTFMKVMGASMAMAGLTGCRRPQEKILPYARKPEQVIPGVANYYATAFPMGGAGVVQGLLVESHEGRPTKVEGNPEHPVSQGATDVFAQASVLNLYDPDRARAVRVRSGAGVASQASSWADFIAFARRARQTGGFGAGTVVLAEPSSSPTLQRLREQMEGAGARWITYRATGDDAARLGLNGALGRSLRPAYDYEDAAVIVSFDADFLGAEDPNSVQNSRGFARSRKLDRPGGMSRFYIAESQYSTTGGMADHRKRMKASRIPGFAAAVAAGLGQSTGYRGQHYDADPMVAAIVRDAQASGGRALFVAGPTQPPAVHALCARLNGQFGGSVVRYYDAGEGAQIQTQAEAMQQLVREMAGGRVRTLLTVGVNPAYDAPAELQFAEAMAQVPTSIALSTHRDETARLATWHLPRTHYLEMWGDGRAYDGTLSVIQPLIAPLYADAHSEIEVVNLLATGEETSGYDLVRETMRGQLPGGAFEDAWRTVLHDGYVPGTQYPTVQGASASGIVPFAEVSEADEIELVVRLSPTLYDGAFSNNAWMQETPHPVTKVTWDNTAIMSRATAARLGVEVEYDAGAHEVGTVAIQAPNGLAVTLPVWIQPGHPDDSVTVQMGYGRLYDSDRIFEEPGLLQRMGLSFDTDYSTDVYGFRPVSMGMGATSEGVGQNVAPLRGLGYDSVIPAVAISAAGGEHMIATTQDHGAMEGRPLVRMANVEQYAQNPEVFEEMEPLIEDVPWEEYPPIWGESNSAASQEVIGDALYSEHQWGMAIDLNACSGCNACVVACQSENNIPVVGKDQVARGREMHWLRLDRYYVGGVSPAEPYEAGFNEEGNDYSDDNVGMVTQAMMCQHCEYAPCESVCPVAATVHSPDGVNVMAYNRCVGTRYCSNNCPYKVRRYNFYNWTKTLPIEVQMQQNPNVTVRYRGVMEKCSYCMQRIRKANSYAHIEHRPIRDGEVKTACQQACPADAIVFGDVSDRTTKVSQMQREGRSYQALAYLNVKPRTYYMARLRNPHPGLDEVIGSPLPVYVGHGPAHAEDGHDAGEPDHQSDPRSGEERRVDV